MPWCGFWGAPFGGFWWVMPLVGFLFMVLMMALCFRGFGRWWWRAPRGPAAWPRPTDGDAAVSELRREVASLRDELRKLRQAP